MLTRETVLSNYKTDSGMITSPGKFEGEPVWLPYLWECVGNGEAALEYERDDGAYVSVMGISHADAMLFPELKPFVGHDIELWESESGFVYWRCDSGN